MVREYKYIQSSNINSFYEIGFGNTLCGIIKKIDRSCQTTNICDAIQIETLAKEIL